MPLDRELVGKQTEPVVHAHSWRDAVIYALGVGAENPDELDFLFEARGPKVLPTFAVVPSFHTLIHFVGKLGASVAAVLHGEQKVIQHRPIPSSAELVTVGEVTGIYDKGKGALVVIESRTTDGSGEPVFDNVSSLFIRGEGGFGGPRGPETDQTRGGAGSEPPDGKAPDFVHEQKTSTEQAALYRLSGDLNPLHIAPEIARMAGFDRPILHGLCTYGFAGRALLRHACGGDPARFRSLSARFSGVVFPGDTLVISGWQIEPAEGVKRYVLRAATGDGRVVLQNSVAEVVPA